MIILLLAFIPYNHCRKFDIGTGATNPDDYNSFNDYYDNTTMVMGRMQPVLMIIILLTIMTMMLMVLIIKDSAFDDYDDNDGEEGNVRAENIFETNGVNKKNKAEKLRGWQ